MELSRKSRFYKCSLVGYRHSASSFVSSVRKPMMGLGFCVYVMDHVSARLHGFPIAKLIPTEQDFADVSAKALVSLLFECKCQRFDMGRISSETVSQNHLLAINKVFFNGKLHMAEKQEGGSAKREWKLYEVVGGKNLGLASSSSSFDGVVQLNDTSIAIFEVKDTAYSPVEGLRQAVSEATTVALMLVWKGVKCEDIAVPVMGSNGYLFQFGVVCVLFPSLPVFMYTSAVLDVNDSTGRRNIAAHFKLLNEFLMKGDTHAIIDHDQKCCMDAFLAEEGGKVSLCDACHNNCSQKPLVKLCLCTLIDTS